MPLWRVVVHLLPLFSAFFSKKKKTHTRRDSNPRHVVPETTALSPELRVRIRPLPIHLYAVGAYHINSCILSLSSGHQKIVSLHISSCNLFSSRTVPNNDSMISHLISFVNFFPFYLYILPRNRHKFLLF
mgnify:CR=1 FL=1